MMKWLLALIVLFGVIRTAHCQVDIFRLGNRAAGVVEGLPGRIEADPSVSNDVRWVVSLTEPSVNLSLIHI